MSARRFSPAFSLLICALLLTTVGALAWAGISQAAPSATVRYVAPGGNCGSASPCYPTLQAAVDAAADGDEVRVAAGTYTGVQTRVILKQGTAYTYTQVVIITKSLTLRGGFTVTNWTTPDPVNRPTVIDAAGQGRGVTVVGDGSQAVTLDGFRIVNGDYTNLGNPAGVANLVCPTTGGDCGGGLLARDVRLRLLNTVLQNNTASRLRQFSEGGGALLWNLSDGSLISNTHVFSNSAPLYGYGGGIAVDEGGSITITASTFVDNHAGRSGGGLYLFQQDKAVLVKRTRFMGNRAVGDDTAEGGAIWASLTAPGTALALEEVEMRGNVTQGEGGAMFLDKAGSQDSAITFRNVLVAESQVLKPGSYSAAIFLDGGSLADLTLHAVQTTLAANRTPALLVFQQFYDQVALQAILTNTLVYSATHAFVGKENAGTVAITHTNTLVYQVTNVTTTTAGSPTFSASGQVSGDPKLDDVYRLRAGSAAIDAGVNTGVPTDLDGEARPNGSGYDIGADEYRSSAGTLRFAQADYQVAENGASVTIAVERVGGNSGQVSVPYATEDGSARAGSDYTSASGTLTFQDGQALRSFTVTIKDDTTFEGHEDFFVKLQNPTGGAALGDPARARVTILEDEVSTAGQLRFQEDSYTVNEATGQVTITVERVNGSSGQVSVQYAASGYSAQPNEDFIPASGTLTFGDGETQKSFTLTVLNDFIAEGREQVFVALSQPQGGAVLGTPSQATVNIEDSHNLFLPVTMK